MGHYYHFQNCYQYPQSDDFQNTKICPKIIISQGTPNSQNNLEKEQCWRPLPPDFKLATKSSKQMMLT
jgi:hypothetical protein